MKKIIVISAIAISCLCACAMTESFEFSLKRQISRMSMTLRMFKVRSLSVEDNGVRVTFMDGTIKSYSKEELRK